MGYSSDQDAEISIEIQRRPVACFSFNAFFSGALPAAGCILNHHVPRRLRYKFGDPAGVRSSQRSLEEDAQL
jgi:hypothetical protein